MRSRTNLSVPPDARKPLQIAVLHLDLGIGGAERLVVDAAVAMQRMGHNVVVFTSHCDPSHSFPEVSDGTLTVHTHGDFLPRSIFGRFMALCAIFRMIWVALVFAFSRLTFDIAFIDQVAMTIPVVRLFSRARCLFYVHHPDLLLTDRRSFLKRLYRFPLDASEEWATGLAHHAVVNSVYTGVVYMRTFKRLARRKQEPSVLYPPVSLSSQQMDKSTAQQLLPPALSGRTLLLSINRFERKKNLALAVGLLSHLRESLPPLLFSQVTMVISGGYDSRVAENVEHYDELVHLAATTGVTESVVFMRSVSDDVKRALLAMCLCVIYTPENEHFGIVPVEAMQAGKAVIACNSGGPLESVVHDHTGLLCPPTATAFAQAVAPLIISPATATALGKQGPARVRELFSMEAFGRGLARAIDETLK